MKGSFWAAPVLLMLLVLPCLVAPVARAQPDTALGKESSYTPPTSDRNATVMDLAWSARWGMATMALGEYGLKGWRPSESDTVKRLMLAGTDVLATVALGNLILAMDSKGRLYSLDHTGPGVLWSKQVLDGIPYDMAADAMSGLLAIVGMRNGSNATVSIVDTGTMSLWTNWQEDLPDEFAHLFPQVCAWVPPLGFAPYQNRTLVIGTVEGKIVAYQGQGKAWLVDDLRSPIVGLEWSAAKGLLISATRNGYIYTNDLTASSQAGPWRTLTQGTSVTLTSLSVWDLRLAVSATDGSIEVWNMTSGGLLQVLQQDFSVSRVAWANSTHLFAATIWGRCVMYGPDRDGDGWADPLDAFPNDPTEWVDTDKDGVGDNHDAFPLDPAEWKDTDGDGVGDNSDAFPLDRTEWRDTDRDGIGDNSDFLPTVNNRLAGVSLLVLVIVLVLIPVARVQLRRREQARRTVEEVSAWARGLGLRRYPAEGSREETEAALRLEPAYRAHLATSPAPLREAEEALETTALNLEVGLRVQEGVVERSGVGADAAFSRAHQLREQMQEISLERGRLARLKSAYGQVDKDLARDVAGRWPAMIGMGVALSATRERLDRLDNTLVMFRQSSQVELAREKAKVARGAYVPETRALRVRGSAPVATPERGAGLEDEWAGEEVAAAEGAPMDVAPTLGHVRARQALLIGPVGVEFAVTVDNTLPEEIKELVVSFGIEGDALRHRGAYKRELGSLPTGRSVTVTFHTVIDPPALREPQHLLRLRATVTGKAGGIELKEELPAKATNLVSALLVPGDAGNAPLREGALGRSGVSIPRVPAAFIVRALEFPSGLMPVMGGTLQPHGVWRVYTGLTEDEKEVRMGAVVVPAPDATELLVEVRGPQGFPARDLSEEVVDSVRYAILVDRRIRLRGDTRPLPQGRVEELADALAAAYLGKHADDVKIPPGLARSTSEE